MENKSDDVTNFPSPLSGVKSNQVDFIKISEETKE